MSSGSDCNWAESPLDDRCIHERIERTSRCVCGLSSTQSEDFGRLASNGSPRVVSGLVALVDDAWVASDVVHSLGGCADIACGEETERRLP